MPEPDDFGLSAVQTLAHVGDLSRSVRHASFWKVWIAAVLTEHPRLITRAKRDTDHSDPSATHEFVSARHVRIGCTLLQPSGRPLAGLIALHGYANVPTLAQTAADFRPLLERGVAVLALRLRGYPGSRADVPRLVEHAAAPDGGGGLWITHGLESPATDAGFGSEWVVSYAVADVVNASRALRALLGPRSAAPIFLHGESMGAALALLAASQLADFDEPARLAIGLPSLGDWPWRLMHHARGAEGAGALIRRFIVDHSALESEITTTLRIFDTVVHARRIRCPVLCKLALRDDVVPAPTAAAVFNALGSDPGRKWRFTVAYGHHDGGVADVRRHALFDRLVPEFLDPAIDPCVREWESSPARSDARLRPAPLTDGEPSLFGAGPLPSRDSADQDLIAAYVSAGRTLDDLPYTEEFNRVYRAAGVPGKAEREVFHRLQNLRKAGKLPKLGRPVSSPPRIDEREETSLAQLVVAGVGSLGQRDQLPYSDQFEPLVAAFNQRTGRNLSPHDVWRLIAKLAK
jgi:cephalosporin-C deacetylase-like acetyl esterase